MKITRVRMDEAEGKAALEKFVFGGHYGGIRVPRGIAPEVVSQYLRDRLVGEVEADDMAKALEVMRFYESADVLPIVKPFLSGTPSVYEDLLKKLYVCQMAGDFGSTNEAEQAAAYLNESLVPALHAVDAAAVMLESLIVLAPAGDFEPFAQRVAAQAAALAEDQDKDEASMAAFDKVDAIQRNEIPRAKMRIEYKKRVLALDPAARRSKLVRLYLGLEPVTDSYFQTWSGRLLRREAGQGAGAMVFAEFSRFLDAVDPEQVGKDRAIDVPVLRAGRALQYFDVSLTDAQQALIQKATGGTMDFLWDE